MFKFVKDNNVEISKVPSAEYTIKRFEELYKTSILEIENIEVDSPTYIYPAGQMGQTLYCSLKNKSNIIAFLDGDINKNNTRLYGTELFTYYPDKLLQHSDKPVNIILCKTWYEKEILQTLNKYSKSIKNIIKL